MPALNTKIPFSVRSLAKAPGRISIHPPATVPWRSSDVFSAYDDPQLAVGVQFMREHAFEKITVQDIVRAAGISRRAFERRFAKMVGRAPKAEILRLRLECAKKLLTETNWTLAQIARKTGFKYGEHLHVMFSQKTGITPGKFRQNAKRRPECQSP
jgi:LacI family transcriptional regulator